MCFRDKTMLSEVFVVDKLTHRCCMMLLQPGPMTGPYRSVTIATTSTNSTSIDSVRQTGTDLYVCAACNRGWKDSGKIH